jgi:excisionase family DNA binding protein
MERRADLNAGPTVAETGKHHVLVINNTRRTKPIQYTISIQECTTMTPPRTPTACQAAVLVDSLAFCVSVDNRMGQSQCDRANPRFDRSHFHHDLNVLEVPVVIASLNEILTVAEVAAELRCSKAHVYNAISGKVEGISSLPAIPMGRRKLVRRAAFEQWKEINETGGRGANIASSSAIGAVGRMKETIHA